MLIFGSNDSESQAAKGGRRPRQGGAIRRNGEQAKNLEEDGDLETGKSHFDPAS
jgi:hypothetical protein